MTGRVGLLGGTFDPPHAGHLLIAQTAREALSLDQVVLLPAPHPPHKPDVALSSFSDRLEMVKAAAKTVDGVEASNLEAGREGPSFTVDTLRACRERFGSDLYFIMGADSLRDLPLWREPGEILRLCTLVIFPRGDIPAVLTVEGEASLVIFTAPRIDLSSTDIRERIERGESVVDVIPEEVADCIDRREIYRSQ